MAKTYNLNKKSDMNRFAKDMQKAVEKQFKQTKFDSTCPFCGKKIKIKIGQNKCPILILN